MKIRTWRFYLGTNDYGSKSLFIGGREGESRFTLVAPFSREILADGVASRPVLEATREAVEDGVSDVDGFLQAALDCAWEAGMRPHGFLDTTNEIAATRRHLEDMRALVFAESMARAP